MKYEWNVYQCFMYHVRNYSHLFFLQKLSSPFKSTFRRSNATKKPVKRKIGCFFSVSLFWLLCVLKSERGWMVSTFVAERNVLETPRAHRTWTQKVKPLNQKMLKMFLFSFFSICFFYSSKNVNSYVWLTLKSSFSIDTILIGHAFHSERFWFAPQKL